MKIYILPLIIILGFVILDAQASPRIPNQKNLNILEPPIKTIEKSKLNLCEQVSPKTPELLPAPFNRNSHNLKNNTVWREIHPRDGQTWWKDEEKNIVWRYLRPNENPETLTVPQQTQNFRIQAATSNC